MPKKIKYENDIYILLDNYCYFCDETNLILSDRLFGEYNKLNEEVEIIEDKKISKINRADILDEDGYMLTNCIYLMNKINEIIDRLNEGDK